MLNIEIFRRIGLNRAAYAAYSALQKGGPMLATNLAEAAKLHRPAAYLALKSLLANGFVFIKKQGKRKYYFAANPELIAKKFADVADDVANDAKRVLGSGDLQFEGVRVFSGPLGIREAFDDVIRHTPKGETFYRYTSEQDLEAVNKYLSTDYRKNRDSKKLERLVISNPQSGRQKRPRLERFIKFIPPEYDLFNQNIIQLIYGDKVSLIDLNTKRVLIIENKALASFQKVIFKLLYKKL